MAIHPDLRSSQAQGLSPQQTRAISAWTEQATASLQSLNLSEPRDEPVTVVDSPSGLRGASVSLAIPLDDDVPPSRVKFSGRENHQPRPSATFRRREPIRRDSLRRREALLKGKDGSRRRQRWENDRLLNNPWAEPPSPNDWAIQPTYPRHDPMPYYLAPLWDVHYAHVDRSKPSVKTTKHQIPKDLRVKLKHARAAHGMLQDLEEEIRQFIQSRQEEEYEDSDEEIVFVGRNGQMHESGARRQRRSNERERKVLESAMDDRAAGFGRWLVYSIASYYGLQTWSVTVGEPARRGAYVRLPESVAEELPRPLWAQI